MAIDLERQKLAILIKELEQIRGRHTELVTVYVPADYNLMKVVEQLRTEQSTAQNIKSKPVRKNVMSALEKVLGQLKLYRMTPPNGLAVFCGNVAEQEGVADIKLWAIEPPEPIKVRLYRCDQTFILEPLQNIIRERELYGLIVVDKSDAEIGLLKGKSIESLKHLESIVPGKTAAGGWSQQRYARVREGLLNDFLKKVGEVASEQLRKIPELKGVIIGGPGSIKDELLKGDFLVYDIKNKVLGVVNTSYTGEPGLRELVDRSEDILAQASITHENKILERFFDELAKNSELVAYGIKETVDAVRGGNVELLLISESFDWIEAELECTSCGNKIKKLVRKQDLPEQVCQKCGGKVKLVGEKMVLDEVIKLAEGMGTKIEMISTQTQKGQQLKELGGIAGFLRYKA